MFRFDFEQNGYETKMSDRENEFGRRVGGTGFVGTRIANQTSIIKNRYFRDRVLTHGNGTNTQTHTHDDNTALDARRSTNPMQRRDVNRRRSSEAPHIECWRPLADKYCSDDKTRFIEMVFFRI